jgi:soluble lytic murein transglycosylase-like protein
MALLGRGRQKPGKRVMAARLMAGCVVLGLYAIPGLAKSEETAPAATQAAPLKVSPKARVNPRAKQAAASRRPTQATSHVGASLLPVPQPLDAPAPAPRLVAKAAMKPAAVPSPASSPALRIPLPPVRPLELARLEQAVPKSVPDDELQTASIPVSPPTVLQKAVDQPAAPSGQTDISVLISKHAARYNVPEGLLRRVVQRESGGNPRLRHGAFVGLMQMRLDTARGMGYRGSAEGLLDADTNLTYGAAYLSNAWKVAGGSQDRAVRLYTSGYYYEAKRKGLLPKLIKGSPGR